MTDPINQQSQLRSHLSAYLTQETIQFFPDIDWSYYYQAHDANMSPKGAIFIDRIGRPNNYPLNLDSSQKVYKIHIRLKIAKELLLDALSAAEDWEEELNDKIVKKLQIEGYQGLFQGIHPDPNQPSLLQTDKNQDDGGKVDLHLFWVWNDQGSVTGDQITEFL